MTGQIHVSGGRGDHVMAVGYRGRELEDEDELV
jgi:hypothetical protein